MDVSTVLRDASSRSRSSAAVSLSAGGRSSGREVRIAAGTASSTSASMPE
nr:hypothetical protein [Actinomadura madurae]